MSDTITTAAQLPPLKPGESMYVLIDDELFVAHPTGHGLELSCPSRRIRVRYKLSRLLRAVTRRLHL